MKNELPHAHQTMRTGRKKDVGQNGKTTTASQHPIDRKIYTLCDCVWRQRSVYVSILHDNATAIYDIRFFLRHSFRAAKEHTVCTQRKPHHRLSQCKACNSENPMPATKHYYVVFDNNQIYKCTSFSEVCAATATAAAHPYAHNVRSLASRMPPGK